MKCQVGNLGTPFPTYTHTRTVNNNYCFPGMAEWGITEISNSNKDLKEAGSDETYLMPI